MKLPVASPNIAVSDITHVEDMYVLTNHREIVAFLADHPFLIPLLAEARRQLAAAFSPTSPVALELTTDPEEGDTSLFARVRTPLSSRASLDRLNAFFEEWWIEELPAAGGLLHFDVE